MLNRGEESERRGFKRMSRVYDIYMCAVQNDTQVFFVGLSRVGALSPGEREEKVERWGKGGAQQWVSFIHSCIYLPTSFQFTDI